MSTLVCSVICALLFSMPWYEPVLGVILAMLVRSLFMNRLDFELFDFHQSIVLCEVSLFFSFHYFCCCFVKGWKEINAGFSLLLT